MGHNTLIGSAIRANPLQLTKHHAQLSSVARPSALSSQRRLPRHAFTPRSYASVRSPPQQQPTTSTARPTTAATQQPHTLSPAAANPPYTTRPPPLTLPVRAKRATFAYTVAKALAYVKFYKTGLKQIITNTRLLHGRSPLPGAGAEAGAGAAKDDGSPLPPLRPYEGTRAHLHLRQRWAHDMRRLPLFAVVLLVCGEFTPLVVLLMPRAVPLTCRIPTQTAKLAARREAALREGRALVRAAGQGRGRVGDGDGDGDWDVDGRALARILGVQGGRFTPSFVVAPRVLRRLRFLGVDDALLVQAGGAEALVEEELRLACVDRAITVLAREESELRKSLARWLRLTDARRLGEDESQKAMLRLLLTEESEWED
ncbi:hypothetical protein BT67DRAFT_451678 [Trichocladium antarcticum]|uniref:Letm1 RBD domain-containing protein n=1 Tax=Trichocladium antarcticum TaxID=1450529 RepID=A0AAN6UE84_9PEZI|nr:hypothetical protein BT67DRAFT_451678 [Trichocladium antarcticum]